MNSLGYAAIFGGALILLLTTLGVIVSLRRDREKIYFGDGGNKRLAVLSRTHGNAAEHIPAMVLGLVLLALLEVPPPWIAGFGAAAVLARILHATGYLRGLGKVKRTGSILTYVVETALGATIVAAAVMAK